MNKIWKFLRDREKGLFGNLIQNLDKETCLDLGAASCEYAQIVVSLGANQVTCVDFNPPADKISTFHQIEFINEDVEIFKTTKKYDLILCLGILEFLERPIEFMMNIKDFLNSRGKIIILLPISKIWGQIYAFYYLMKGIPIHPLNLKEISHLLVQKNFVLEKTITHGIFSGFSIYSVKR